MYRYLYRFIFIEKVIQKGFQILPYNAIVGKNL